MKQNILIFNSAAVETDKENGNGTKSAFMALFFSLPRQKRANLQITRFKSNKNVQCT